MREGDVGSLDKAALPVFGRCFLASFIHSMPQAVLTAAICSYIRFAVAANAGDHLQNSLPRQLITRIDNNAKVRDDVLDMRLLEKSHAGLYAVWNIRRDNSSCSSIEW